MVEYCCCYGRSRVDHDFAASMEQFGASLTGMLNGRTLLESLASCTIDERPVYDEMRAAFRAAKRDVDETSLDDDVWKLAR